MSTKTKPKKPQLKAVLAEAAKTIPLASSSVTRKLDLAAGQNPREGYEGVDIWPGSKHVVDLLKFPWPFADASVAELHCSHFVEHIPMFHVDDSGVPIFSTGLEGKDLFFRFFEECQRILVPGGWMQVHVPCHRSDRAFQDPTHRRFITQQTFLYLSKEWRAMNKLDHYNTHNDWGCNVGQFMDSAFGTLHDEVQAKRFPSEWNLIIDWVARLQKK